MPLHLCDGLGCDCALMIGIYQITTMLCVTNLPPNLFDHTPPGVFDGQGSGHDFYGVSVEMRSVFGCQVLLINKFLVYRPPGTRRVATFPEWTATVLVSAVSIQLFFFCFSQTFLHRTFQLRLPPGLSGKQFTFHFRYVRCSFASLL